MKLLCCNGVKLLFDFLFISYILFKVITMSRSNPPLYLVSACLIGLCTRYDGKIKASTDCLQRVKSGIWIPICPEQLGGLPTPREAADIKGGDGHDVLNGNARVMTQSGVDLTAQFIKGAQEVLALATSQKIEAVFLKKGSPSCAVTKPCGVTAALLMKNDFSLEEF